MRRGTSRAQRAAADSIRVRRRAARLIPGALLAAAICPVAACTSGAPGSAPSNSGGAPPPAQHTLSGTAPSTPGSYPAAAWPEFGQNAARTGVAAGLPAAGPLSLRWTARLDGAVYGQPLVVGGMVIAATENDSVYALSESAGHVLWRTHVGTPVPLSSLPCGNIDPLGITGTPVYDQDDGLVYAVAETTGYHHVLFGLSVRDGSVQVERDIPAPDASGNHPANNQQRPGLAIGDGRVYATFGGLTGDCGQYIGSVVGVPLSGSGPLVSWHTPTSREGAIWGTAGPVAGPGGNLYISVGNGAAGPGQAYDGSDSVTELTPALHRAGFFAPTVWADDNSRDLDLGSTQPALAAGNAAFIMGKRGVGYLLDTAHLGGIGGQLASRSICAAFGAAAVNGDTVYEPCSGGGMAAITVNAAQPKIGVLWRGPSDANGSPVVGGGAVWVTRYSDGGGTLYELDPATGAVKSRLAISEGLPHFSSLSLADGTAFVSTLHGVVAIGGA
jgi:outer membrane protein assembly factor BamB